MKAWFERYGGWLALLIVSAAYFPRFVKAAVGMQVYPAGAECMLKGVAILPCAPLFPYPPLLAFTMIPFVPLPMMVRVAIWYVISVAATVGCFVICEQLARRLFPVSNDSRTLFWLRVLTILFGLKFALAVFEYQAFDTLALFVLLLGVRALTRSDEISAGGWLAVATAVKATPLVFLPYLIIKRRFLAAGVFTVVLVFVSFLPDLFFTLTGRPNHFFLDWVRQVTAPSLVPGTGAPDTYYWNIWMGENLNNQSLRGLINRLAGGPQSPWTSTIVLTVYAIFCVAVAALLLKSPRVPEYAALDAGVLLISTVALSPITSRYHFVVLLVPYSVLIAAWFGDKRTAMIGAIVLGVSFVLVTGTSNDLVPKGLVDFAYWWGFLIAGAIVLMVYVAALLWWPQRRAAAAPLR